MKSRKKIKLLPLEIQNKYMNRYLTVAAIGLCIIIALVLAGRYIQIGVLSWQTDKIIASNEQYDKEKEVILNLEENIKRYHAFLKDYENECFPFSLFMYDLEAHRPSDVFIISVDSSERLINEGVQDEKDKQEDKQQDKQEENDEAEKQEEDEEVTPEKEELPADEETVTPEIGYTEDLAGREIVIRGYGQTQKSISQFIYDITHLSYIGSSKITAIEEHEIENGVYNIFEFTVTGGVY